MSRRWSRAAVLSAALALALGGAACQSQSEATTEQPPPAIGKELSAAAPSVLPVLHYEPELDFFYASVEDGGEVRLEPGFQMLFLHDLLGALEHFTLAPQALPEQKLSRAVGLGRTYWQLAGWYDLAARMTAEGNLGYVRDIAESASRGFSQELTGLESFVAGRSALYLGRKDAAMEHLARVDAPEALVWKAAASGTAPLEETRLRLFDVLGKRGTAAALEAIGEMDWKKPTDGRLWDPYLFAAASRVYLEAARQELQEAAAAGAAMGQKLDPAVLGGVHYQLALACFRTGQDGCVQGLDAGTEGSARSVLARASASRAAGKRPTLAELAPSSSSMQAGVLAALLAEGSALDERIEAANAAIEWGTAHVRKAHPELWPGALQRATVVPALLRQRQAEAAEGLERETLLSAALDRLREAQPDLMAAKNDPLYMMQVSLLALQRSGCADLSLASGTLNEKMRQGHSELAGPLWVLGGINARHCGASPEVPASN
jgi:hypothetical protein